MERVPVEPTPRPAGEDRLTEDRARAAVERAFPDLGGMRTGSRARGIDSGWDFFLLETDDGILFRFPRNRAAEDQLVREIQLLPELATRLPVPVPRYEWVGRPSPEYPYLFAAYRKLRGTPVSEATLAPDAAQALARSTGLFLDELHRFPAERARALGVRYLDGAAWRAEFLRLRTRVRLRAYPRLEPDLKDRLDAEFDRFLSTPHFLFPPALIHRDLGGDHLLVQPGRGQLVGVIDWGDVCVGDPVYDFTAFTGDPPMLAEVQHHYRRPLDPGAAGRLAFYGRTWPVHGLVHFAETEAPAQFQAAAARLEALIRADPAPLPPTKLPEA
jgi:aminoglycoside phosphotransferase (APT) family kinase protein